MEFRKKIFNTINRFILEGSNSDLGKENANFIRSLPVLEHLILGKLCQSYLFEEIYKDLPVIQKLHDNGFIYHHQASKNSAYCIGLSSYELAVKGLQSNATNERASSPPKRIDTLLAQAANLICLLAQEVSGATSVNDLSTVLAGYLYHMERELGKTVDSEYIQNSFQSFLYNVNLPFRSGNSPFSNITLDFGKATPALRDKVVAYSGQFMEYTYGDIPPEYYDRINRAFIDAMTIGDHLGNPFTFPLVTVNVTDNFNYEDPCWLYFLEQSEKFGGFYLQNYCTKPFDDTARKVNPYHTAYPMDLIYANCCRLTLNIDDLINLNGSNPFASGSGIGGIGVIAINLNRILWLTQGDSSLLYPMLDYFIDICSKALEAKRTWLRQNWKDLFPYLSYYVKDDKTLFSIISVLGMHEGLKSIGYETGIFDEDGKKIAHDVARYIHEKVESKTKEYGSAFTLEFAPSESAACKLAEKDIDFAWAFSDRSSTSSEYMNNSEILDNLLNECYKKNYHLLFKEDDEIDQQELINDVEEICTL